MVNDLDADASAVFDDAMAEVTNAYVERVVWGRGSGRDAGRMMVLDRLARLTDGLMTLSAFVGPAGLIFVTGVIVADVVGRNMGLPLYGAQDLVTMTMVLIVFRGMALCDRTGGILP